MFDSHPDHNNKLCLEVITYHKLIIVAHHLEIIDIVVKNTNDSFKKKELNNILSC